MKHKTPLIPTRKLRSSVELYVAALSLPSGLGGTLAPGILTLENTDQTYNIPLRNTENTRGVPRALIL